MKQEHTLKRGFIIGLLAALLLTGCSDVLLQAPPEAGESAAAAGEGAGQLTVSITGAGLEGGERTLFPTTPQSFSKYELIFTPLDGQDPVESVTLSDGSVSHTQTLAPGDWTVTAVAYIHIQGVSGIYDGEYEAARGSADINDVTDGSSFAVSIDIKGGVGQGRGVFRFDITLPVGLDSAFLEFLTMDGSQLKNIDLINEESSGAFGLDAGYYLLKISRTKSGVPSVRTEVVHIYEGWTTEATGPKYDFTGLSSAAEIVQFLSTQPGGDMASNPVQVVLSGIDLERDFSNGTDPLGLLYEALEGKYVALDLSGCAGNIPSWTFYEASARPNKDKIVSVVLSNSLSSIGDAAFYGCSSLESIDLPDSLDSIGYFAFSRCISLLSIALPDSLDSIVDSAFSGCSSLASVDLPDSLSYISNGAFSDCSSLVSIDLPNSLDFIGDSAFYSCSSLVSIDLPDSLTSIGSHAFSYTALVSIDLPDSLSSIGASAFEGCGSLESIALPESLNFIGQRAFEGCSSLATIALPNSLSSISGGAFYGCNSLESIDLPDSLRSIGDYAFFGCRSLAAIDLPASLTSIYEGAFYICSSLESIALPNSLTSIGDSAFFGCSSLESIDLPDSLRSIGDYAFEDCGSLVTIDLPDSLSSINYGAFNDCSSLASVDLPESLSSIGAYAFNDCSSLNVLISRNTTVPDIGYDSLKNTPGSLLIYVPDESVNAYKTAFYWSDYASKIKPLSTLPPGP